MTAKANELLLETWLNKIKAIKVTAAIPPQQRAIDSKDVILGTLSPELQQYWFFLEQLRVRIEDLTKKLQDQFTCHEDDHSIYGDNIPEEKIKKFNDACNSIKEQAEEPLFDYSYNWNIFWKTVHTQYPKTVPEKQVYGIREGYHVISRAEDDRGDGESAVRKWEALWASGLKCQNHKAVALANLLFRAFTSPQPEQSEEPKPAA